MTTELVTDAAHRSAGSDTKKKKKRPPEFIYLQCCNDDGEVVWLHGEDVTWCTEQINEHDAKYALVEVQEGAK